MSAAVAALFTAVTADAAFERALNAAAHVADPLSDGPEHARAGAALYARLCVDCHGASGRGDGPSAPAFDPPPANLQLHVPQHTAGELYFFITRGIPGTAMPAWRTALTPAERWQLVRYLRELSGP